MSYRSKTYKFEKPIENDCKIMCHMSIFVKNENKYEEDQPYPCPIVMLLVSKQISLLSVIRIYLINLIIVVCI